MADPYSVPTPQQNNFAPIAQGVTSGLDAGADYAVRSHALQLQQQQLKLAQDQFATHQKEIDINMGKQLWDGYQKYLVQRKGPLKEAYGKSFSDNYETIHQEPPPETWMAAAKDENAAPFIQQMMEGYKSGDPAVLQQAYQSMTANGFPADVAMSEVNKAVDYNKILEAARLKGSFGQAATETKVAGAANVANIAAGAKVQAAQIMGGNTALNRNVRTAKGVNSEIDTITKQPKFSLEGVARINDILQDVKDGKIKSNGQVLSSVNAEFARLERQSNVIADAGERRIAADSFAQNFRQLLQKIADKPEDTVNPDWIKQLDTQIQTMKESYMGTIDSAHTELKNGWLTVPGAPDIIENRFNKLRDNYSKRLGGWNSKLRPNTDQQSANTQPASSQVSTVPTAEQIKSAGQLKLLLNKASADERPALLNKIKQAVPAAIRQKVGIPEE